MGQTSKEQFVEDGFLLIQNCIPSDLLRQLRTLSEKYRKIARRSQGAQAQRLQPLKRYSEPSEQRLLETLIELPALQEVIASVLSSKHHISLTHLGMMFEPKHLPYCMPWHRDWRDNCKGLDMSAWYEVFCDLNYFNQINCPLYEDSSLWVVRGSHCRTDIIQEQTLFPTRPILAPYNDTERKQNRLGDFLNIFRKKESSEREKKCLEHCEIMPEAEQVILHPGDALLYRNTIWHLGNYLPSQKRATLHTTVMTEPYQAWMTTQKEKIYAKQTEGQIQWGDPYAKTLSVS
jgi:ectoine hydroxylase-related dioxygenase (phytanoyl-CoA dioxygenase family)